MNRHAQTPSPRHPQAGFVLVVALVLLLILTMLGLAAAQSTSLQERMAGNARNHQIAFQAAEAALRAGETGLYTNQWTSFGANVNQPGGFASSGGLYFDDPNNPPASQLWQVTSIQNVWTTAGATLNFQAATGSQFFPSQVAQQPVFVIEQLPPAPMAGINLGQAQFGGPPQTVTLYRITALGTGGNINSQVMLQEIYWP